MSLLRSPLIPVGSSSYQTTQATVSSLPVKAMSGWTPERVGSMLSVGSPLSSGVGESGSSRSRPTCCQQKPFSLFPPAGFVPTGHAAPAVACLRAFATKICRSVVSLATPSFSSHATHGTGSAPATAAPPATDGFSAVRRTWMLSDGRWLPPERSCPEGSQRFAPALKRLAKMLVGHPRAATGSYPGTPRPGRPAPAEPVGAAPSPPGGAKFGGGGEPLGTQGPVLEGRTENLW